jgi:RNA polymerase sigma-70 factor, ECF subfamily
VRTCRCSARSSPLRPDGSLVVLREQDRTRWDRVVIKEGRAIVRRAFVVTNPVPISFRAAINAVHADAPTVGQTDWSQTLAQYG